MKLPNLIFGLIFTLMMVAVMAIYILIYEKILSKTWEIVAIIIVAIGIIMGWYFFFKDSLPRIIEIVKRIFKR